MRRLGSTGTAAPITVHPRSRGPYTTDPPWMVDGETDTGGDGGL